MTGPFYQQVAGAFDRAAGNYDDLYGGNRIMAWMRAESLAVLQAAFATDAPGGRLLEVGCGTGEEALALSRAGHRIVATDISPAMIELARAKAEASGVGDVTWLVLPAGRLPELVGDYGPGSFDGAYASFGGLNCEPDLRPVAAALADLLRPGASLVCSIMNRLCAWEIFWGLLHLQPGQAFRRLSGDWVAAGLVAPEGRLSVPTRYYRPGTFARAFAPHFRLRRVRALPVFLPPPYLDALVERHPALLDRLEPVERGLRDRFPFHSLGDHFLAVLQRAEAPEMP
ncbi:MAG TPA: methyltransferase domain-containing protein [Anaerolineae bacterium]|nr:methyltransferase domain-containing protein [Anaerolineae bacterium]